MADDSFEEVTRTSWFSRLGQAFAGVLAGLVFFFGALVLLFWNEGRAVETAASLREGLAAVVSIPADRVDPANEGRLVHLSGLAETSQTLTDPVFGVSVKAIRLKRAVQMYQWKEESRSTTEKNLGGSETTRTTYTYGKAWSDSLIDSGAFKKPEGHANPPGMAYAELNLASSKVTVGAFELSPGLIGALHNYEDVPASLPPALAGKAQLWDRGLFVGADPNNPQVGDLKIVFSQVRPSEVSLYAAQRGNSFAPYRTANGHALERIEPGHVPAQAMFAEAKSENEALAWVLRAVGTLVAMIGLGLLGKPVSVLLDVLPFLGSLAGAGIGFLAFVFGLAASLLTIASAWVFHRPLVGAGLAVAALGLLFLAGRMRKAGRAGGPA